MTYLVKQLDWNISRMEFKVYMWRITEKFEEIGIYPEWNVKNFKLKKDCLISL